MCVNQCFFPQTRPALRKPSEHRWAPEDLFVCVVCRGHIWPGQLSARLVAVEVASALAGGCILCCQTLVTVVLCGQGWSWESLVLCSWELSSGEMEAESLFTSKLF